MLRIGSVSISSVTPSRHFLPCGACRAESLAEKWKHEPRLGPCDHKEDRGCFSGLAGDVRPLVMSEQRVPPLFFFFIESPSLILMEHVKWLVTSTCQEGHNRGYPPLRDESEGSVKNETACMRRPAKSGHALHKA